MQSSFPSYAHFSIVDIHVVLNIAVRLSGWLDASVCKPGSAICMLQPRRLAIVACMAPDLPDLPVGVSMLAEYLQNSLLIDSHHGSASINITSMSGSVSMGITKPQNSADLQENHKSRTHCSSALWQYNAIMVPHQTCLTDSKEVTCRTAMDRLVHLDLDTNSHAVSTADPAGSISNNPLTIGIPGHHIYRYCYRIISVVSALTAAALQSHTHCCSLSKLLVAPARMQHPRFNSLVPQR